MTNAILTITYIRSTIVEHQREFVEHFQYGKQIGKILDLKNKHKRHRAPKHVFLGLRSEKSGNRVPYFGNFETYLKIAHEMSVQNGSYAFSKRVHEVPIWSKTDLGGKYETL